MKFYSQIDPEYAHLKLGNSSYNMGGWGCFLTSIANLGQVHPVDLLKKCNEEKAITSNGLLISGKAASLAGITLTGRTNTKPDQDCIAVTRHYQSNGVPTHFYILLKDGRMIDPLDKDPQPRESKYIPFEYRLFSGSKIRFHNVPEWAKQTVERMEYQGITTSPTETVGDMPLYHLLAVIDKFNK